MKTRVHYPEEIKWKVIEVKKDGYSNRTIEGEIIKNVEIESDDYMWECINPNMGG
ncbi:hypothetical protein [Bacillus cereus]|uniref:hypothetical protein n=1 Tax=Bacillus cereus TaxID=1396 RepID=UPI00027C021D|nr:hypothetical protein [Bacillus cereus]EJV59113.1 hypothetical protein IEM_04296 [Bacillus cereus BAG6O-2]